MKGPFERLKYDFRRLWECPACRHRVRTGPTETFAICECEQRGRTDGITMRLIEEEGQRRE